ncbi:MAG: acyl carrier protein [Sulfurifustis sp.]
MSREWTRDEVVDFVKKDLLLERLDLANTGVTLDDIKDDTPLLHDGLAIDSVDALDLLVEVEKTFGVKFPDMGRSFIERTCKNVQTLADVIIASLEKSKSAAVS